ncbi:MAG: hypothetical protein BECKG1743D_GA0114223_112732 [Candidatus Kentron sp. G]|nr:MAG: hypothetical protein BECKG1743E_GA0114224_112701 [Candidatus Kentron sp. G]VFN08077.1 MAG: hypothetical protein BECKG1743D_GA0114223_112732 [Candidatus Kentron sp. G]
MEDSYRNWLGGGLGGVQVSPATALRRTRLAWIASDDEERRDPKYWAP